MVSRVMTPSESPAMAINGLIVEQGSKPEENAIFWFTMERTRPFVGSTATTEPFSRPSASSAACRTTGSSFKVTSSLPGSEPPKKGMWKRCLPDLLALLGLLALWDERDARLGLGLAKALGPVPANTPASNRHKNKIVELMIETLCIFRSRGLDRDNRPGDIFLEPRASLRNCDICMQLKI